MSVWLEREDRKWRREKESHWQAKTVCDASNLRQIARQTNASRVPARDRAAITASPLWTSDSGALRPGLLAIGLAVVSSQRCSNTSSYDSTSSQCCDVLQTWLQSVRYKACVIHTQCLIGNNTDGESVVLSSLNSRKGICEAHLSLALPPGHLHFEVSLLHFYSSSAGSGLGDN